MKYEFDIAHCQVCLYVPEAEGALPVIWLPYQKSQGEKVFALLQQKCVLACATGMNWNDDLSPWPAPRLFASSQDFGGKASSFLSLLCHHILPAVEAQLSFSVDSRGIAGYSMAGLFALYAIYHTDLFLLPLPFPAPYGLTAGSNMRFPIPFRRLLRTYTFPLGKKSTAHATPEWRGYKHVRRH